MSIARPLQSAKKLIQRQSVFVGLDIIDFDGLSVISSAAKRNSAFQYISFIFCCCAAVLISHNAGLAQSSFYPVRSPTENED